MLRTANEMNTETKEAFENYIMEKLTAEACKKSYSANFSVKDIPEWLQVKLGIFGYELEIDEDLVTVSWENVPYVE